MLNFNDMIVEGAEAIGELLVVNTYLPSIQGFQLKT